jgi:hypothetical protein
MSGRTPDSQDPGGPQPPDAAEGLVLQDDVTHPDDELRAAFAPSGPRNKTSAHHQPDRTAGHTSILAAAERYAASFREQPNRQREWAESAPPPVRALFLAIRANTLGDQVRDPEAGPYRYDPTLPRLNELSAELQALLRTSWPAWDEAQG